MSASVLPSKIFYAAPYGGECEDPYPSLSDFHDYEPNLEFDDSDLQQQHPENDDDYDFVDDDDENPNSVCVGGNVVVSGGVGTGSDYLQSPMSDGTIEEDFEAALAREVSDPNGPGAVGGGVGATSGRPLKLPQSIDDEDFGDIARHGIIEVVGDDQAGRKVIVISSCRLPSNKAFDHQRFLRYLMHTLDQYVDMDYSLVYFHHGLTSKNKPPLRWLWEVYKALDRRYKKNLKSLYLVHPTNFIRVVWNFFKPIISVKFGRKVQYVNYLHELAQHMDLERLPIPKAVIEHDTKQVSRLGSRAKSAALAAASASNSVLLLPTQQFGASLDWIRQHHPSVAPSASSAAATNGHAAAAASTAIPPIMLKCVDFLSQPDCLETEGIFRLSVRAAMVKELKQRINQGEEIVFESAAGDVHIAAVILKTFLGELQEPIMTFDRFEQIVRFQDVPKEDRLSAMKQMIDGLPEQNYVVLKYLVEFLSLVIDRSCLNKMTSSNLAVVFGPNLAWSKDQSLSLANIGYINYFTEFLLTNQDAIFN